MADPKSISELVDVGTLELGDLFIVSHVVNTDEYGSRKVGLSALSLAVNNAVNYEVLETTNKTVLGAVNELLTRTTYKAGDEVSLFRDILAGFVTGSSKSLRFQIPLPRTVEAVSASISGIFEIRTVGGQYIISGGTLESLGTVSIYKNSIGLMVEVLGAEAFPNAVNNTPVAIYCRDGSKLIFN